MPCCSTTSAAVIAPVVCQIHDCSNRNPTRMLWGWVLLLLCWPNKFCDRSSVLLPSFTLCLEMHLESIYHALNSHTFLSRDCTCCSHRWRSMHWCSPRGANVCKRADQGPRSRRFIRYSHRFCPHMCIEVRSGSKTPKLWQCQQEACCNQHNQSWNLNWNSCAIYDVQKGNPCNDMLERQWSTEKIVFKGNVSNQQRRKHQRNTWPHARG